MNLDPSLCGMESNRHTLTGVMSQPEHRHAESASSSLPSLSSLSLGHSQSTNNQSTNSTAKSGISARTKRLWRTKEQMRLHNEEQARLKKIKAAKKAKEKSQKSRKSKSTTQSTRGL
jgi:G3E family GTPase